jgi:hypothetical protein
MHSNSRDGDSVSTMSWSDDNHRSADVIMHGEVRWNDDATDVVSISSGGSLEISTRADGRRTHVEILPKDSGLQRTLIVDGTPRSWDAAWFADFLQDLDRHTGFAADQHASKLYRERGAKGVLDWSASLRSDHARDRYLTILTQLDPLAGPTAIDVLGEAARISGSYDRAQVLMAVAGKARLETDAEREAFLHACDGIKGDYEHARVLHALIDRVSLTPALTRTALASAATIRGDYEKAGLLVALAEHHTPDALEYLAASSKLSGSYERSRALKALIAAEKLDGPAQVELIHQTTRMGDYESAEVLVTLSARQSLTGEALKEYESAAKRLGDYSRNRVLAALHR